MIQGVPCTFWAPVTADHAAYLRKSIISQQWALACQTALHLLTTPSPHASVQTHLLMFRQFSLNKAAFIVVPVISAFSPNILSRVCGSGRLQPCAFFCLVWRNSLGWDVFVWDRADSLLAGAERGGTRWESDSLNKLSSRTACFPFALLCWTQTKGVCWTSKYFCLKPR